MKIVNYSHEQFIRDVGSVEVGEIVAGKRFVYGVPSGGVPFAMALAERYGLKLLSSFDFSMSPKNTLVVDDIIDSGRTRGTYTGYVFLAIHAKEHRGVETSINAHAVHLLKEDKWIHYWWEKKGVDGEDIVTRMLEFIGEDPTREGLLETPKRVIKSWKHIFGGIGEDPNKHIKIFKDGSEDGGIVISKDIQFYSNCEHHLLPFHGVAHIAYIPADGRVLGLSKLARILDVFARRPQVQERLTREVAQALMKSDLKPKAVACVIKAEHFCMKCRGVNKQGSSMITSEMLGLFRDEPATRQELMNLISQ